MAAREVVVSVAAYTDVNGVPGFAIQGETIDVHPDHVERFDRLNIVPGTPVAADPVIVIDDGDDTNDGVADDPAESEDTPSDQPEDETPTEPLDVADVPATGAEPVGDDRLDAVLDLGAPKRPARSARVKG